jgi:hypothetical protein
MFLAMRRSSQQSGRSLGKVKLVSLRGAIAYLVLGRRFSKTLRTNRPNCSGV